MTSISGREAGSMALDVTSGSFPSQIDAFTPEDNAAGTFTEESSFATRKVSRA